MSARAYYNENDPFAAAWLKLLIGFGLIAPGEVDTRSIEDVAPDDLRGFTQCHFFAGIGGWSYALRLAGVPDDRPIWTGSCPCQPYSAAGSRRGADDARNLWWAFRWHIAQRRPPIVFGEQVASKDGREWFTGVSVDLEILDYRQVVADLCAPGIGAPHIRQRLYWLAFAKSQQFDGTGNAGQRRGEFTNHGDVVRLADSDGGHPSAQREQRGGQHGLESADGRAGRLEHATRDGWEQRRAEPSERGAIGGCGVDGMGNADTKGLQGRDFGWHGRNVFDPWSSSMVIDCTDGTKRRFEPESFPLAHGIPNRVGLLRGYGNAIVPQVAAAFIEESLKCIA